MNKDSKPIKKGLGDLTQRKKSPNDLQINSSEIQLYLEINKKENEIKKRASSYFDRFISASEIEVDYKETKEIFIKVVLTQFLKLDMFNRFVQDMLHQNVIPLDSLLAPSFISYSLDIATDKKINEIIFSHIAPLVYFLRVLKPHSRKINNELKDFQANFFNVNNELEAAHYIIKKRKKSDTHKEFPIDILSKNIPGFRETIKREAEKCRNKKGKISYRKLGRSLGVSHPTAKSWCIKLSIQSQILQLK